MSKRKELLPKPWSVSIKKDSATVYDATGTPIPELKDITIHPGDTQAIRRIKIIADINGSETHVEKRNFFSRRKLLPAIILFIVLVITFILCIMAMDFYPLILL